MSEITTPAAFLDLVNAFRVSRIILTATELNVFDHLGGRGKSSDELSKHLDCDSRALDRLLNALVSIGLLEKSSSLFTNTPFASLFLVSSSPAYMSGLALTNHTWKTWSTLTDALYAGTSVHFENPINERPEEWQEAFIAAMHRRAGAQAVEVADALDLSQVKRVLDVGGGSGAFTMEFLNRNPEMTGVVFDLPKIVPITEKYITTLPTVHLIEGRGANHLTPSPSPQGEGRIRHPASGIRDRISVLSGDYLKDDFGSGYDLVFMSAIIHINSPEENQLLIQKSVQALNPGGKLVIVDHIMNEMRTEPKIGAIFAINMLVGTKHGDTYTEQEIRSWMATAGLTDIKHLMTPGEVQLMVGRRT